MKTKPLTVTSLLFILLLALPTWSQVIDSGIAESFVMEEPADKQNAVKDDFSDSLSLYINRPFISLSLEETIDLLLIHNHDILNAKLAWFSSQNDRKATYGDFEPELVGSYKHQQNERYNSIANELKDQYKLSLEGTLFTGTKYSLGFNHLNYVNGRSSLEKPTTYSGVTLEQPLLRGLWFGTTINNIRVAKTDELIAYHTYRASLISKIFELQTTYWKLCYTQENFMYTKKSLDIAEQLVEDSKARVRAGKMSHMDEIEALAGLAARKTAYVEAADAYLSSVNNLKLLIADSTLFHDSLIVASSLLIDSDSTYKPVSKEGLYKVNPEICIYTAEFEREKIVTKSKKDRILPELNIKGSYGIEAQAATSQQSFENFGDKERRNRVYSAELELRVPLGLNITDRNLYKTSKLAVQSKGDLLRSSKYELNNNISLISEQIEYLYSNITNSKTVVQFNDELLEIEIKRLQSGVSTYRRIYEIEDDLTEARRWHLRNLLNYHSSVSQYQKISGSMLLNLKLETLEKDEITLREDLLM